MRELTERARAERKRLLRWQRNDDQYYVHDRSACVGSLRCQVPQIAKRVDSKVGSSSRLHPARNTASATCPMSIWQSRVSIAPNGIKTKTTADLSGKIRSNICPY